MTSNTVQFGARLGCSSASSRCPCKGTHLRCALSIFAVSLHGRHLGLAVGEGVRCGTLLGESRSIDGLAVACGGPRVDLLLFWSVDVDFEDLGRERQRGAAAGLVFPLLVGELRKRTTTSAVATCNRLSCPCVQERWAPRSCRTRSVPSRSPTGAPLGQADKLGAAIVDVNTTIEPPGGVRDRRRPDICAGTASGARH